MLRSLIEYLISVIVAVSIVAVSSSLPPAYAVIAEVTTADAINLLAQTVQIKVLLCIVLLLSSWLLFWVKKAFNDTSQKNDEQDGRLSVVEARQNKLLGEHGARVLLNGCAVQPEAIQAAVEAGVAQALRSVHFYQRSTDGEPQHDS